MTSSISKERATFSEAIIKTFRRGVRQSNRIDEIVLVLMVVTMSVQGPTLFTVSSMGFTIGHALVGLVCSIAMFRCLYINKRLVLPPVSLHILFAIFVITTIIDSSSAFGFGTMIFKYLCQYFVLLIALNMFMVFENADVATKCIIWGAWVSLGIVLINAICHYNAFIEYYAHPWDGHPNYSTVSSGGINLEATWPAMLGVFFTDDREGHVYLAVTFLFSAVVQSRAAILLSILAIAYVIIVRHQGACRMVVRGVIVLMATVCALLFVVIGPRAISAYTYAQSKQEITAPKAESSTSENTVTQKKESTSSRPQGVPGRRGIWAGAFELLPGLPITGYGAGNAMDAVRSITQYPYREDNVHNYPLQILLDFGVIGFTAFSIVTIVFLIHVLKTRIKSPFAAFIILYLVGGLIQFAGGELFIGFALAGYFAFGPNMQGGSAWALGSGRLSEVVFNEYSATKG